MKKYFDIVFLTVLLTLLSCEKENNNPVDKNQIDLEIYSFKYEGDASLDEMPQPVNIEMEYVTNRKMAKEGEITLTFGYEDVYVYMLFAKRKGFYTKQYYFNSGDTIMVDLDTVVSGKACGTVFLKTNCSLLWPVVVSNFVIYQNGDSISSLTTDDNGRFAIDPMEGAYEFGHYGDAVVYFYPGLYYNDYIIELAGDCPIVRKPNIYIYPEETTKLDVELEFSFGGSVITSIPEYNKGWLDLEVDPDGTINGEFEYLFYESVTPDLYQRESGWVVAQNELESFFRANMTETGFKGREIEDFIEYWIPLLKDYAYYVIYPQYNDYLEKIIQLKTSSSPDNLIRLIYSIEGRSNNSFKLKEPQIPAFSRDGFTITEWGGVLNN